MKIVLRKKTNTKVLHTICNGPNCIMYAKSQINRNEERLSNYNGMKRK